VELHTHIMDGDVMRMVQVEEGFAIPPVKRSCWSAAACT
jgi:copper(I)-binding protein